jgi:uncharacterized repeat protein (TIGR03803 family)
MATNLWKTKFRRLSFLLIVASTIAEGQVRVTADSFATKPVIKKGVGWRQSNNQSRFYGVSPTGGTKGGGWIFTYDPLGNSIDTILNFDNSIDVPHDSGYYPVGPLLSASDGKIYGATSDGGLPYPDWIFGYGVLFCIDTTANNFTKLHDFKLDPLAVPRSALIQASNGKLYGTTSIERTGVYSFDPVTNVYRSQQSFPIQQGAALGPVTEAADGKLYGSLTAGRYKEASSIFSYDVDADTATIVFQFESGSENYPYGFTAANNGKLYWIYGDTLFSFLPGTKIVKKEYQFAISEGIAPFLPLTLASDGLIYGTTAGGGKNGSGVIFSFNPNTNEYRPIYHSVQTDRFKGARLVEGNGRLYGIPASGGGIFSFDTVSGGFKNELLFDVEAGASLTFVNASKCILPIPEVSNSGPVCPGAMLQLHAEGGLTYEWTGPSGFVSKEAHPLISNVNVNNAGTYYVKVKNSESCFAIDSTIVLISPYPSGEVIANGPLAFCQGDSVELKAIDGVEWLWNNGQTTQSVIITTPGIFTVSIRNETGCTTISSGVEIRVTGNPPKPFITFNGTQLSVAAGMTAYKWYLNGTVIPSATLNTFRPLQPGSYQAQIFSENCSTISDVYNLQIKGDPVMVGTTQLYCYPNPVNDHLNIYRKNDFQKMLTMQINDFNGRLMMKRNMTGSLYSVSLMGYPAGIYTLFIIEGSSQAIIKFVKL